MSKEQLQSQLKWCVNEYIKTTLTELTDGELTSVTTASNALISEKLLGLVDIVDKAIQRIVQGITESGNLYWEDGRFYTELINPSVPNNVIAITEALWDDWCDQKDSLESGAVTEKLQNQILIRKSRFTSSEGQSLICVEHIVTTETPNRTKLFYFMSA